MYHAIVFLPLLAFLIVGTFGRVLGDRPSQWITCGAVITSAILSLVAFWQVALGQGRNRQLDRFWHLRCFLGPAY